ncbi:MAG: hypothetical protein IPJ25_04210 [Rhodocyclaceae bacterium]|nr:hypothetical protein [Rhodocyclaceae bacterium]
MTKKTILTLGFSTRSRDTEDVKFDSARSLLEFDIAVIDWDAYIEQLENASHQNGYLETNLWVEAGQTFRRRTASLDEFLNHGRLVVALSKKLPPALPYLSQGSISHARLNGMVPTALLNAEESHGTRIGLAEKLPPPLRKFAESVKDQLNYFAVLRPADGTPVMTIEGTQKPVALWCPHESGGGTLFCPFPAGEGDLPFIAALFTLSEELCAGAEVELAPLPQWHSDYLLPQETAIAADLLKMDKEVQ